MNKDGVFENFGPAVADIKDVSNPSAPSAKPWLLAKVPLESSSKMKTST